MKNRSMRFELTFWYSLAMGVTLLAAGVAIDRLAYNRIVSSVNNSLRHSARNVRNEFALVGGNVGSLADDTAGTILNPPPWPTRYVQLLNRDLRIIYRSRNLGAYALPIDTARTQKLGSAMAMLPDARMENGETIRQVMFPLSLSGNHVGWGQVGVVLEDVHRARRKTRFVIGLIIPCGIAVSTLVGRWLAKRSMRPIDDVTRATRRIGAENLNERLEPRAVDDELGRLISTLNGLLERLETNFRQVSRFSADVSHELRTPLTIIQGEAEVAMKSTATAEEMRQALEVIVDESRHMSQLVRNLLTLARLETGHQRVDLVPVPLKPIVEDLAEEAHVMAVQKGISLNVGPLEEANILGDPVLLHQVGFNLIDNAVKYTPSGGRIGLKLETDGKAAKLVIEDSGIGIDPSEKELIFNRFYRSDKTRNQSGGGSGLGLSLVRQIVDIHHGSIDIESNPGDGSTFVVSFPVDKAAGSERREPDPLPVVERTHS